MALKKLKDVAAFEEFTSEAAMLEQLDHRHVVHFYGVHISPTEEKYIVTEFMSQGSLMDLVKNCSDEISTGELVRMYVPL